MPSIAQIPMPSSTTSSPVGGKKRRRDQISSGVGEYHTSLSRLPYTSPTVPPRVLFTISSTNDSNVNPFPPAPRLLLKPRLQGSLRFHDAKRQRISRHELENTNSRVREAEASSTALPHACVPAQNSTAFTSNSDRGEVPAKNDLSPCHICHQKPKVRTDLDSYSYCEGCQKRTCYICMRECLGLSAILNLSSVVDRVEGIGLECHRVNNDRMSFTPWTSEDESAKSRINGGNLLYDGMIQTHAMEGAGGTYDEMPVRGHRGMICSQCCVERGSAGEVRCFGCLRAEESL